MNTPEELHAALAKDIASHVQRIDKLKEIVRLAEEEIAFHEALIELSDNKSLIEAIGDLLESPSSPSLSSDPRQYCADKGIALPEGVSLEPADASGSPNRVMAKVRRGAIEAQVVWDQGAGFYVNGFSPRVFTFR
jgi:hypothetical protein